jgi:hypothetical protein
MIKIKKKKNLHLMLIFKNKNLVINSQRNINNNNKKNNKGNRKEYKILRILL